MSIENPNFDPENVQSVIEEENLKCENEKICKKSDDSKIQNSSENETKMSETDISLEKRKLQNMLVLGFSFLFIFAGFLTAGATRKFSEIFLNTIILNVSFLIFLKVRLSCGPFLKEQVSKSMDLLSKEMLIISITYSKNLAICFTIVVEI